MRLHIKFTKKDIERLILKEIETEYPDQFHEAELSWEYWKLPHVLPGKESVYVHDFEVDVSPSQKMPPQDIRLDEEDEKYARWHSDNVSDPYRKPVLDEEDEWRYRVWKGIYPEGTK